jgi:hypothetical protein
MGYPRNALHDRLSILEVHLAFEDQRTFLEVAHELVGEVRLGITPDEQPRRG